MKVATLNKEALDILSEGLVLIQTMKDNKDYLDCIKAIMGLMEIFEEDKEFHTVLFSLREETKNLWRSQIKKSSR